jgi:Ca-activated chloride channel homolog
MLDLAAAVGMARVGAACGVATLLAGLVMAQTTGAPPTETTLRFSTPFEGRPASGSLFVEVYVDGPALVESVVLYVDEEIIAAKEEPPYRFLVELGEENRAHSFEAIAYDARDVVARRRIETPAIPVDEVVDINLRQLYVTVTRAGSLEGGLDREAFTVLDQGRPQNLVTFADGSAALTLALLLDTSISMMGEQLALALAGLDAALGRLELLDEASVYAFDDQLRHVARFAGPGARAADLLSLGDRSAQGGTALNDVLYLALRNLERRQGRRVVILLSDGVDVHSALSAEDVRRAQGGSDAMVYWIFLDDKPIGARQTSVWRTSQDHLREQVTLRRLVEESGGRVVAIRRAGEIADAFHEVFDELRSQYVLGFYPSQQRGDGSWHRIEVIVRGPGLGARTRRGYYDR